ncbi:MAG: lasso peptide biosynthesis B2 protein [Chitinophagaceae bacterium]|nr:lasso peptide biosynthesis B2 protein [Chitinophagaceae bacterium]
MNNRSPIDYFFFVEAWAMLHLAKLVILFVPFKKIASWMGRLQMESTHHLQQTVVPIKIEHAVRRASRYTLHESKCYDQALTAKALLGQSRLPSTIYFGLAKEGNNQLMAHAWVRCGSRIITGKAGMERFTIVACFGDA